MATWLNKSMNFWNTNCVRSFLGLSVVASWYASRRFSPVIVCGRQRGRRREGWGDIASTQSTTVSFMTSCFCVARHITSPLFFSKRDQNVWWSFSLWALYCLREHLQSRQRFRFGTGCTSSVFHPPILPPPQLYLRGNLSLERDDSCNIFLLPLLSSATKWNCALASWCTLWGVYCSCIKVHSHSQVSFRRSPRLYRSVLTQTHCAVD